MPRIGKKPVMIPTGVQVTINGQEVAVKGPKGELKRAFHPRVRLLQTDKEVQVTMDSDADKQGRELWGTTRVLLHNMIVGVSQGFTKQLEINGVGYRAAVAGSTITLSVGFSHPVEKSLPPSVTAEVKKNLLTLSSIDKQLLGQVAAEIRNIRKPEPYKGTGIKYADETIRRKAGKVVKAAGS